MNTKVLLAVFQKNLESYFTSWMNFFFLALFAGGYMLLLPGRPLFVFLEQPITEVVRTVLMFAFLLSVLGTTWSEDDPPEVADLLRAWDRLDVKLGKYLGQFLSAAAVYSVGCLWPTFAAVSRNEALVQQAIVLFLFYWIIGLLLIVLGMCTTPVLRAVFKRNFVSYFSSPTGYVFICVFVLLSTIAAFWPPEFFNANLDNLDQLNGWFPFIMLVFIPAITMGIWSDERRQGTDELLLTLPAADFDIVLGKYLAAVAIFTVSLAFSLVCSFAVLRNLGEPDVGLFLGTYFGYWLIGLAMLAIGMVASFLTSNLTMAFVFGAMFNAPLVFVVAAEVIMPADSALAVKFWSVGQQFADFGRGMIAWSGIVYFASIAALMLYLSMVLIGRRHWPTGESRLSSFLFYPLVHLLWLGSFVTLWYAFKGYFSDPTGLLVVLALGYLLVQAGLLWLWSEVPNRQPLSLVHCVVPLGHVLAVQTCMILGVYFRGMLSNSIVFVCLLVLYLLLHAAIFAGWWWFPRHISLMPGQYIVRALALAVVVISLNVVFQSINPRWDVTSERILSLSPSTVALLDKVNPEQPVQVEAFISPKVPESYIQTRLNLVNMLRELEARGKGKVKLVINSTDRFSEQAARAEQRYDIQPRRVTTVTRGAFTEDYLFMGVAFSCGLQKVVIPFIDRGIPVEYELVRSIATVTQQKRKKVGVLNTDAQLYGRFSFEGGSSRWPIIDELEKQYDVVQVDPTNPITEKYDVLLAVQPSSLAPEQMDHFIAAVTAGQPTAIFEDPFPYFASGVPGTSAPRQMPPQMAMFGGQPPPKGDISPLWAKLGVDFPANKIVWQDYNPYPKVTDFSRLKEFVFVDGACGADEPFGENDAISSGLQHVLFPFPGAISKLNSSDLEFTPLVRTGTNSGTVDYDQMLEMSFMGGGGLNPNRRREWGNTSYVLAAHIRGKPVSQKKDAAKSAKKGSAAPINVVLVTDIDMLHEAFFRLREVGEIPGSDLSFDFDNVTLVLNTLDSLAGDDRFIELRKRRPKHRTLTRIEAATDKARKETAKTREKLQDDFTKVEDQEKKALEENINKLREQMKKQKLSTDEVLIRVGMAQDEGQRRMATKLEQLKRERDRELNRIETQLAVEVQRVQDRYKTWAVVLPPILPLAIAVVVFLVRRAGEVEGVSRRRLRG